MRWFQRVFLAFVFVVGVQIPLRDAYAQDGKQPLFFDSDCLEMFGMTSLPASDEGSYEDETKVHEERGTVEFDKIQVTERRNGEVTETFVQIRNCRRVTPPRSL